MTDTTRIEKARAAREARDHVVATSAYGSDRVGEALRRYLGAEHYRELKDAEDAEGSGPDSSDAPPANR